jgi:DNA repair exonuclease SbcCD ATPase subunit
MSKTLGLDDALCRVEHLEHVAAENTRLEAQVVRLCSRIEVLGAELRESTGLCEVEEDAAMECLENMISVHDAGWREDQETIAALRERLREADEENRKLTARAEKAEAERLAMATHAAVQDEEIARLVAELFDMASGGCLSARLEAMTEAKEKAETLAEYRLEALEARDRAAQYYESRSETGYCWYCHTDACEDCAPNCPTVTHPKEGRP